MQLFSYTVGPFSENTYLLVQEGKALLVDPGFNEEEEFNRMQKELETRSADLVAVVLTHAHVDHVMGTNRVTEHYPDLPFYLCDRDRYLWDNYASQARMFGFPAEDLNVDPEPLPVIERWEAGPFAFEVRYTPGHAPDHVVLYNEKDQLLLGGDTLFRRGIGRYDLYKGDFKQLEQSIREQIYTLPDETVIYPGHGPRTTVGYEKKNNPFVSESFH